MASGLWINYQKSAAIVIRGDEEDTALVAAALPWSLEKFPCRYLGLQLSIFQLKRSEWQPVVDSVIKFLPGWQRGMISRPGRLTLVNSVIMARPTHHPLIAEAPKWAMDRIDKCCHAFFW